MVEITLKASGVSSMFMKNALAVMDNFLTSKVIWIAPIMIKLGMLDRDVIPRDVQAFYERK